MNVIARRPGASRDQIVIMAARDSQSVPDATGSAADTAALLELARVIQGRPSRKTLVLASVDGSTLGDAGARRFARTAEDRDRIEAVIVLSNLGAKLARAARSSIAWSNDDRRGSIGLQRTATASVREELGAEPSEEGALGQFVRLAYPLGLGAQGPLLAEGIEAIRISGSGELPPPDDQRGLEDVNVDRLGQLGRSTLRLVSALDTAAEEPEHGPGSYVAISRKVLPGWVLSLLAATLLLPALVASIDAFARARRRREDAPGWWRMIALWSLPFLAAFGMAELLVLLGPGARRRRGAVGARRASARRRGARRARCLRRDRAPRVAAGAAAAPAPDRRPPSRAAPAPSPRWRSSSPCSPSGS